MIQVRYFARLRDQLGSPGEEMNEFPPTIGELAERLAARGGNWAEALGGTVLMAINQEMVGPDAPLKDGDEVAFLPPVTGG
ncbi:MAG: molybdopterin converting factor subunit 1 [Gammaproteobacteria bacterium]|nr:MAG: molybdopterin converting factor subunit 1 [Gammaproteobacteria bacterium]